jgi:hypothetical protein
MLRPAKNMYVAISAVCAVAGVLIAAIQTFGWSHAVPVEVKVELNPAPQTKPASEPATVNGESKTNSVPEIATNVTEVTPSEPAGLAVASLDRAKFLPATRQDTPSRFALPMLFDSNPSTYLKLAPPDADIDFIVEFPFTQPLTITGMEIDAGEADAAAPAKLEVMILPSGTMEGSGRAVSSFDIRPGGGVQKFVLPPAAGRGAWIRIAAQPGASETIIGDMKLITSAEQ